MYKFIGNNSADRVTIINGGTVPKDRYNITIDLFNENIHIYDEVGNIFIYMVDVLNELNDMFPDSLNAARIAAKLYAIYDRSSNKDSLSTANALGDSIIYHCKGRAVLYNRAKALVRMQIKALARFHTAYCLTESSYAEFYYCHSPDAEREVLCIKFGETHVFSFSKTEAEPIFIKFILPLFKTNITVRCYNDIFHYIETVANVAHREKYVMENFEKAFIDSGIANEVYPEIYAALVNYWHEES